MTTFLATLSADHADNWDVCKRSGLWGTGTSNHAKSAAGRVRAGDAIVIWTSQQGVTALARATGVAQAVTDPRTVPWPEPQRYSFVFPIEVVEELSEPAADQFKDMVSVRFGLKTHYLQAGLIAVPEDVADRLLEAFSRSDRQAAGVGDSAEPRRPVSERPLAGVHLHPAGSVAEALLALYRRAANDPDGELLVIGDETDRWVVEAELQQHPFESIRDRVRFTTADALGDELRQRFSRGHRSPPADPTPPPATTSHKARRGLEFIRVHRSRTKP